MLTPPPPLIAFILSLATFILILGLTSPFSLRRRAALPLMIAYIYLGCASASPHHFHHPLWANLLGGSVFSLLLLYTDAAMLSAWAWSPSCGPGPNSSGGQQLRRKPKEPSSTSTHDASVLRRLWWATCHIFNTRLINTPFQVANVPPFSRADPAYIPSTRSFLLQNSFICALCFFFLDAMPLLAGSPEENAELFGADKVHVFARWREVRVEELVLRVVNAVMWLLVTWGLFRGVAAGSGVICVWLGISEVRSWKPLFGDVEEAWSVRQFWGHFWHQSLRQPLTSPARFVTYTVLGFRKGGIIGRYLFIFNTFLLSGLLHIAGDMAAGIRWHESGVVQFFCIQTLGIMIEDSAQVAWRKLVGSCAGEPSWWQRVLGYIWVLGFLAWSVPVYTYPAARRGKGEGVLPFSVVDKFL